MAVFALKPFDRGCCFAAWIIWNLYLSRHP